MSVSAMERLFWIDVALILVAAAVAWVVIRAYWPWRRAPR